MAKTIVLLDDDQDEQSILKNAFSALNIDVDLRQLYTVEQLLEYLHIPENVPEILLIDVNLAEENGLDCLRRLQQCGCLRNILTVIYTNASDEHTISLAFEYGAGVYMKKVNTLEKLMQQLRTLLAWNGHTISELPIRGRTLRQ